MKAFPVWLKWGVLCVAGAWLPAATLADPLKPLKNVPKDHVEIVQEAREYRYKNLEPRLAELGDRAMQAFFDAGMPDLEGPIEEIMKKVDAREFIPDVEAMFRENGRFLNPTRRSQLKRLLEQVRSENALSLFDLSRAVDILVTGRGVFDRQPGAVVKLAVKRFPWSLFTASAHEHPRRMLNSQFAHHMSEAEVLVPENYPGQSRVDAYSIDDLTGFAAHDVGHGEDMFLTGLNTGVHTPPTSLKEALTWEVEKAKFLAMGRAHPEFFFGDVEDFFFQNGHDVASEVNWMARKYATLPKERYKDLLDFYRYFFKDDALDFDTGVRVIRGLESESVEARKLAVTSIAHLPSRDRFLRSQEVRKQLKHLSEQVGDIGVEATRLLALRVPPVPRTLGTQVQDVAAHALEPLRNVPADMVDLVRKVREARYRHVERRLAELGDRALQVYFDAGMPEDEVAKTLLLDKVDAREFLVDVEKVISEAGKNLERSQLRALKEMVSKAKKTRKFSLLDAAQVAEVVLGRGIEGATVLAASRFPWSLLVASARPHPEPRLNESFLHHYMEVELLLQSNYPGQKRVDVYDIEELARFAIHDFGHVSRMFPRNRVAEEFFGPRSLKEALELELAKAEFLDWGRANPDKAPKNFEDLVFRYFHENPRTGHWILEKFRELPEARHADVLRFAEIFFNVDAVDFETGLEVVRLLESSDAAQREQAVLRILESDQTSAYLNVDRLRKRLFEHAVAGGGDNAFRLLGEQDAAFYRTIFYAGDDIRLRHIFWAKTAKVLLDNGRTAKARDWVHSGLVEGLGAFHPELLLQIQAHPAFAKDKNLPALIRDQDKIAFGDFTPGECIRRRLRKILPWAALGVGGVAARELWIRLGGDEWRPPLAPSEYKSFTPEG